jgi:hypothetical protein
MWCCEDVNAAKADHGFPEIDISRQSKEMIAERIRTRHARRFPILD